MPDSYGAAILVSVPGAPAIDRTPEEIVADALAGRQWINTAALSGGRQQLYGKALDGWIYVDPNGARWLVRCPQLSETIVHSFGSPLSGTLTLARFGELGGAAESYSYPFTCAWGVDGSGAPSSGRVLVDAVASDGSSAIIMVHERRLTGEPQIRWPHSFLEVTVSGLGDAAIVACAVVKSRMAVSRAEINWPTPTGYIVGYYIGPPDYPDTWRVRLASDPTPPGEGNFLEWGGRAVGVYSGAVSFSIRRTLAIWYDASGNRVDVEFAVDCSGSLSMPIPDEPHSVTQTGTADWTAAITVGGAAQSQVSGSWSATSTVSETESTRSRVDVIDGQSYPYSENGPGATYQGLAYGFLGEWRFADGYSATPAYIANNATTFSGRLAVVRYSPQVIGLRADRPTGYAYHPPATPSGVATGPAAESDASRKYGSHDPHIGACAWLESTPVCYV
jgi:hypothetical protein